MIDEIFKTPVCIESLDVNLKELKDLCLKERVKDKKGERKSNTGYQSGNINIDLYIFPASLKHYVFPFKSPVTRISISGNILLDQDSRIDYFTKKDNP